MGVNLYVYTGPYFEPPTVEVEETDKRYMCSNGCTNKSHVTGAFCPTCGKPINLVTTTKRVSRKITPDDLDGDWVDVVAVVRSEDPDPYWLPNKRGFGETISEYGELNVVDLDADKIAADTTTFVKAYKAIADAVKHKFGVDLKVGYGVVPYVW